MARLILVSNRLPITVKRAGDRWTFTRSSGGLVAGLGPVHEQGEGLWIGSLGTVKGSPPLEQLQAQRLVPVQVPPEDARRHYEGYSNTVLWPLLHYLLGRVHFDSRDFEAYRRVNQRFADVVAEHARPGDQIWIHDYHLMLLPQMLRERLSDASIGFFLHIPFPSSEVFRILPRKEEILRGLLGANLIGLHTWDYARHLVSSFGRVLGVEFNEEWVRADDETCRVGVFPLGVDTARMRELASRPETEERVRQLREVVGDRKVILGVDRLDYTKGLPVRLRAFRRLLKLEPHWRDDAIFLQLAVPSRASIGSYRDLKDEVDRLVGRIAGEFAQGGFVPLQYMYRSVPPEELAALYRLADVMFVTPIRDGMNLVAKEFVASRLDDTGVLVLSEFAGASSEMGEALLHNPWDIDGTARTLDRALRLDADEIAQRMSALRRRVELGNVHRWVDRFITAFTAFEQRMHTAALERASAAEGTHTWMEELLDAFHDAQHSLLVFDYDGTLTELAPRPEDAEPDPELLELLASLTRLPGVEVAILSGRDSHTLDKWLGQLPLHLLAEHGARFRPARSGRWQRLLDEGDTEWKHAAREVLEDYTHRLVGAEIEDKATSLSWHYRRVEPGFGSWQAQELLLHLSETFANAPIEVLHGAKVIEVRPLGLDKGHAYRALRKRLGPFEFVLAAGDDRSDEDLFQVLPPDAWTVKVGTNHTHARFRIDLPRTFRSFLGEMVQRFRRGRL